MWRKTLTVLVKEISEAMVTEGEARAPFQLRDIRRTCETMLAALKVSKDVRSNLLSHGLGGVQSSNRVGSAIKLATGSTLALRLILIRYLDLQPLIWRSAVVGACATGARGRRSASRRLAWNTR